MELHTAKSDNKTHMVIMGMDIQAINLSIECMLYQLIDNKINTDWIESVLFLNQQQRTCITTTMAFDSDTLSKLSVSLLAYNRAVESLCLKIIEEGEEDEGDNQNKRIEAIVTITRKQQPLIEKLLSVIADI